ncbi:hypothetical protein [Curtobacterium flaccumfaciens]|uniref:hypothetical protein n=1 Tax=Curtobacterium flaccumfaciens TaxID=2035 RepID=UPI00217DC30B|nr:hypothetical protein [Curtobacterium flaccumfaciens]MCS6530496.1 hypothetical protein [Curtobacterium flaccumfaciens pv. flaccumfaciens]
MWRKVRVGLRIAAIVLGAALAVEQAAVLSDFVKQHPTLDVTVIFAAAGLVVVDNVVAIGAASRNRRLQEQTRQIEKAVVSALVTISRVTGVDLAALGGSVFVPRGIGRRRRLHRIVRSRMLDEPQQSSVRWEMGKGVIGRVWGEKRQIHKSIIDIGKKYGDVEIPEAVFSKMSKETRMGFDRVEFQGIAGKYAEILGIPVFSGGDSASGEVIAVLAFDVPRTVSHALLGTCLKPPEVREVAASCATTVGEYHPAA